MLIGTSYRKKHTDASRIACPIFVRKSIPAFKPMTSTQTVIPCDSKPPFFMKVK